MGDYDSAFEVPAGQSSCCAGPALLLLAASDGGIKDLDGTARTRRSTRFAVGCRAVLPVLPPPVSYTHLTLPTILLV